MYIYIYISIYTHLCISLYKHPYVYILYIHVYMCITALSWPRGFHNSMMLLAMPFRATQDGWIIVKHSDKLWSTGGGNGNPLRTLAMRIS